MADKPASADATTSTGEAASAASAAGAGVDVDDTYIDGFWLTPTAYGVTLTLLCSQPQSDGTNASPKAVGRLRMGHQVALELAQVITKNITVGVVSDQSRGVVQ